MTGRTACDRQRVEGIEEGGDADDDPRLDLPTTRWAGAPAARTMSSTDERVPAPSMFASRGFDASASLARQF